ncbi:MAG: hypothetical protein RLZZ126_393, partial [Pseudomonadota bacterium]
HGAVSDSRGQLPDEKVWPVKYTTMFHMTNDSGLFLKPEELQKQGYRPATLNRWVNAAGAEALPLYEGKMVQMFDHRAADVVVNVENLHRAAQQEAISQVEKASPSRYPEPQFLVAAGEVTANSFDWALGFKEITAPTNVRSMIATFLPRAGFGNKVPLLVPQCDSPQTAVGMASIIAANLNCFAFDFVLRQKLQGQTINLFILEQLPVIVPDRFEHSIGGIQIAGFVRQQVLALTYTAHDMAPFASDMGYVYATGVRKGQVKPPFVWDEEDRRRRMAALDGLFFHLYGLDANDAAYIMDSFPIVREQDEKAFGRYRTKEDVLAALEAVSQGRWPVASQPTSPAA